VLAANAANLPRKCRNELASSGHERVVVPTETDRRAVSTTREETASMADRSRFEQIYDNYSGLILAYASRRTNDPEDAADVVAETFMVAWRRMDSVPPGDEARPWLYGIARRVLANQRRSLDRRSRLDSKLRAVASQRPDHTDDAAMSTVAALDRLRESDRELLTLTAWDGLDANDLAVVLGCSPATARVRLHRARKHFEQILLSEDGKE
jgi:RNA polymerase sigma factor (sigma-70 family)